LRRWYDPRRSPSIQHFLNGPPGLELPLLGQRPRLELGECRDVWKPRRGLRSQLDAAMMAVANHPLADESIPCFLREGFHDVVKLFNSLLLRRLVGLLPLFLLLPPPVVLISAHTRLARSSRSLIHADGRSLGRRSRHCFYRIPDFLRKLGRISQFSTHGSTAGCSKTAILSLFSGSGCPTRLGLPLLLLFREGRCQSPNPVTARIRRKRFFF